ncbi:CobQ/CobB/MinD/ParA nucleotide binding domain-containing protein [Paenibacillus sp. UNC499MF]|nr:CobQ/CobB/MinD/ParA nucleotide binding domain-containing protein [Paenibacillus sp. UNC499MF]
MKIITYFNNKGGVGKTTLAVNVASFMATHFGKKVLFLDADPQANSTQMMVPDQFWLDYYGERASKSTIMNFLSPIIEGDSGLNFIDELYMGTANRYNVDLIPGHPGLSVIEDIFSDAWNKSLGGDIGGFRRTNWLRQMKQHYASTYDYMFIDVGPSLGALNRSILLNTDFVVTPMGSDIFSLIGVSNISTWIKEWMHSYRRAVHVLYDRHGSQSAEKYLFNLDIDKTTKLIGFSIQQYVTRTFADGRRPIAAYESIIIQVPEAIEKHLNYLIYNNLTIEELNLGDVPYLYSLVPLAQASKSPMYSLVRGDGVVGGQTSSVKKYKEILDSITRKLLKNMGDLNAD